MDNLPSDYVPELRPHPPWLMDEMVASEPSLVPEILSDKTAAAAIGQQVKHAHDEGMPIAVVGCGTSETAAMALVQLLRERLARGGRRSLVEARQALEAALDPWPAGLCVGISHEGGTRATVLAMEAARAQGAATALITARAGSAAVKQADRVYVTPRLDRSWCHTVGYLSPILAGAAIAEAISGSGLEAGLLERSMRDVLTLRPAAAQLARALAGLDRIIVTGAGPDCSPAQELALKMEEGAHLPARMLELETLLHGHLAAADPRTGLVLIATGGAGRALNRTQLALKAAQRIGMPVVAVVSVTANQTLEAKNTSAGRLVLPNDLDRLGLIGRFCGAALALQLLTLELAAARGTNPDLIRREQAAYREAAQVAEADGQW